MDHIFVSALPFKINEDQLRRLFEPYGNVKSIEIFADWENARSEPYAHILMDNGKEAIACLDGKQIGSTYLRVNQLIKLEP